MKCRGTSNMILMFNILQEKLPMNDRGTSRVIKTHAISSPRIGMKQTQISQATDKP